MACKTHLRRFFRIKSPGLRMPSPTYTTAGGITLLRKWAIRRLVRKLDAAKENAKQ